MKSLEGKDVMRREGCYEKETVLKTADYGRKLVYFDPSASEKH